MTRSDPLHSAAGAWPVPSKPISSGLYIVSTPIGNLRDVTFRALDTLAAADLILAEDTRITRRLLDAYGVKTPMRAYHDHNAESVRPDIIARLGDGAIIAQVSDAGTPMVSDPGYKLARAAIEAGADVVSIPGASAALAGLTVSGMPSDAFVFAGFPPAKSGKRRAFFEAWAAAPASLIVYEAGPRLADSLSDMAATLGDRPAAVARELTKAFEETRRGSLTALAAHYAQAGPPKGEIVVVIGPPPAHASAWDSEAIDQALVEAMREASVKDAAAEVADLSGQPKRALYQRALALKDKA